MLAPPGGVAHVAFIYEDASLTLVSMLSYSVSSAVPTFVTAATTASEMKPARSVGPDEVLALLVANEVFHQIHCRYPSPVP